MSTDSQSKSSMREAMNLLQQKLFDLTARNPLINCDIHQCWLPDYENIGASPSTVYKKAKFFEKEYGLDTTLWVSHFLRWKKPNHDIFITSPLLCREVKLKEKHRETILWDMQFNSAYFINPVIKKIFHDEFNLVIPDISDKADDLINFLVHEFNDLQLSNQLNDEQIWQVMKCEAVGIFNYKKLSLSKDYDWIKENPGEELFQFIGEEKKAGVRDSSRPSFHSLLDHSQLNALTTALQHHTVIQGPPGTGKSHLISTLIKNFMLQGKKVLFVSEKRSALEIVYNILKKEKLHQYTTFFNTEKDQKKQFYSQLKKTYLQVLHPENKSKHVIEPLEKDTIFSQYPDKVKALQKDTGYSIQYLHEKLIAAKFDTHSFIPVSNFPGIKIWENNVELLHHFEHLVQLELNVSQLTQAAFFRLNSAVWIEQNPVEKLIGRLDQLEKSLATILTVSEDFQITKQFDSVTKYAIAASMLSMVNRNQIQLLDKEHKTYKTFNNLAKKYQITLNKLKQIEQVNKKWSDKPTIAEITELTGLLKQQKKRKSILGLLKRNAAKQKNYFTDFSDDIALTTKLQLLEEVRLEWKIRGELEEIKIKLLHQFEIQNPDTDIDHILQVRSKLNRLTHHEYETLLSHAESEKLIKSLAKLHQDINHASGIISFLYADPNQKSISELIAWIKLLRDELDFMERYQFEIAVFNKVPSNVLNLLHQFKKPVKEIDLHIAYQELLNQTRFIPAYKNFEGITLLEAAQQVIKNSSALNQADNERIETAIQNRLASKEKLLYTPSSKLKEEGKKNKHKYKEQKKIISHELSKTKQYLPVKSLLDTCDETIIDLLPVWIMNPVTVSQFIPAKPGFFDVVIADEASQIPLEDFVPSAWRAKHFVLAGDSQQMPPSHFFTSSDETKSLLDHGEFLFQNTRLQFHYRSKQPELIEFSNRHFYDNELKPMPGVDGNFPIRLINIEGVFENGINREEAKSIAEFYKKLLSKKREDIAIIAFSKEQQDCIEKEIQKFNLPINDALLVRNLENIQGIEKEIVLISIGYAPGKDQKFRLQFGPLNQDAGANRLNVLFSRAIEQMVIFSSVRSGDFGFSENRGVQILRDFLQWVEQKNMQLSDEVIENPIHKIISEILRQHKIKFRYHQADNNVSVCCFVHEDKILLADPGLYESDIRIPSLIHALQKRFSHIMLVTSNDLLYHFNQTVERIKLFFTS
ncbi:MAG: hypothetical protein IPH66_12845 [Crocinitomicaceae bacterium]|nr:hypothetical protein [Crocinitomicaceae bacterium]